MKHKFSCNTFQQYLTDALLLHVSFNTRTFPCVHITANRLIENLNSFTKEERSRLCAVGTAASST